MPSCFSLFSWGAPSSSSSDVTLTNEDNDVIQTSEIKKQSLESPTSSTTAPTDTTSRLSALRTHLEANDIDLYIVPSEDAHGSEYTAPRDRLREFISGFTGSAGVAIIGRNDFAGLWADGRYHFQAGQQLDSNWQLFKVGIEGVPSWDQWLADGAFEQFGTDSLRIGGDARLLPFTKLKQIFVAAGTNGKDIQPIFEETNFIRDVWTDPELPFKETYPPALDEPVHQHPLKFAGQEAQKKIQKVIQWLGGADIEQLIGEKDTEIQLKAPKRGDFYVIDALDEIAWLLNLRGASIPNNPVFPSFIIISAIDSTATLFISPALLSQDNPAYKYVTESLGVKVADYDDVWDALRSLPGVDDPESKVVLRDAASWALVLAASVGAPRATVLGAGESPIGLLKAVKNPTELQGFRNAYLRDGVAWAKWAAWLEELIVRRRRSINEYDAAQKLIDIRSRMDNYAGFEAYDAISATGPNAALPHYETPEKGSATLDLKTPYLNDSGAQYFDGTIDTTRTVHFGKPTAEQKRAFTRVLQGHIAIDSAVFPKGTTGATLDVLARRALWQDGLNYLHGTGHGIGSFLNVHEGPQGFSTSSGGSTKPVALHAGMVLSNEPGYYKTGRGGYGIRIESMVGVQRFQPTYEHSPRDDGVEWFRFERFTKVPIAKNLIEWGLLNDEEKKWIQKHNDDIKKQIAPFLKEDKRALEWLKRQ